MRWLVTGAAGMLGRDVLAAIAASDDEGQLHGAAVTPATRSSLDITNPDAVRATVAGHDVVVNCAAWTAVDAAETHESEAFAANAMGPALLARACRAAGARLVHISTDYVFAGSFPAGVTPTPYAEDAPIAPRSAYGRTKAAGEWAVRAELPDAHWILRTAWLYGAHGPNFVRTMARLEGERDTLDVVDDQRGQPTWSWDLARRIVDVVRRDVPPGTYHATASGETSWYGLARAVFTGLGADPDRIRSTTSDRFPRPAPRPAYSVLGHSRWSDARMPALRSWEEALAEALDSGQVLPPDYSRGRVLSGTAQRARPPAEK